MLHYCTASVIPWNIQIGHKVAACCYMKLPSTVQHVTQPPYLHQLLTEDSQYFSREEMISIRKPVESEKDLRQETLMRWECYSQENPGLNIEPSYI